MSEETDKAIAVLAKARIDGEHIATDITLVTGAAKAIMSSGLTERALIVLIQDITGLPKGQIKRVIDALEKLSPTYVKPKRGK